MNDMQRPLDCGATFWNPFGERSDPFESGIRRLPMHVDVANSIRDLIVKGRLNAGERINEYDLARFLHVSRTPLREALKELQREGLVVHEPNKGSHVSRITVGHTAELFESLAAIERFCGEIATRKITNDQLERFTALHEEMFAYRDEADRSNYFEINERIHRAYVLLSGNSMLNAIHDRLIIGARRIRFTAIRYTERWTDSVAEHKAILAAMEARQAEEVGRLIEQHVLGTGEYVCGHLREIETEQFNLERGRAYEPRPGL